MSKSKILIIGDWDSVYGAAFRKVAGVISPGLDTDLWPKNGIPYWKAASLSEFEVFWILNNKTYQPAIRFHKSCPKLLCFETQNQWGCFLKHYNPDAKIVLINRGDLISNWGKHHLDKAEISLNLFAGFFHDLSNIALKGYDTIVCQRASGWLNQLNGRLFAPFAFFSNPENWENWSHTPLENRPVVPEELTYAIHTDFNNSSQPVEIFFYNLCRTYMAAAKAS